MAATDPAIDILRAQLTECQNSLAARRPAHVDLLIGTSSMLMGALVIWALRRHERQYHGSYR